MRALKTLLKKVVASPLGWQTVGRAVRSPGVVVLMYHRVGDGGGVFPALETGIFEEQMRWLRANCWVLEPGELRGASRARGPQAPVLVTFDDGYRDYHDNAYPILKHLGIPAVVFLPTSLMDEGGLLWTDAIDLAFRRSRREQVRFPWLEELQELTDGERRMHLSRSCKRRLKSLPDEERRRLMATILDELGLQARDLAIDRQMLTWNEVRATQDLTTYGGHSHTHPILPQLNEVALQVEIETCRDRLVAETGRAPRLFAYPNGDFSPAVKAALAQCGFETGFATIEGVNGPSTDWMEVRRIPGDGGVAEFAWLVTGRSKG